MAGRALLPTSVLSSVFLQLPSCQIGRLSRAYHPHMDDFSSFRFGNGTGRVCHTAPLMGERPDCGIFLKGPFQPMSQSRLEITSTLVVYPTKLAQLQCSPCLFCSVWTSLISYCTVLAACPMLTPKISIEGKTFQFLKCD